MSTGAPREGGARVPDGQPAGLPGTRAAGKPVLAVFDLDHTLLDGDSDVLWCDFLMAEGVLDPAVFGPRNQAIEAGYRAGTVGTREFCEFFIGTLAGHTPAHWAALRERYLATCIQPRLLPQGMQTLAAHRAQGHRLLMSTATNRFLAERTAQVLGFEHLVATDSETDAQGRFTGRVAGEPNMRAGKIQRLHAWLQEQGLPPLTDHHSVFYSDSMNDLPLLSVVDEPVAVNGDERLGAVAGERAWAKVDWR